VTDPFGPEISDLIVDYDAATLARRDVMKQHVLDTLRDGRVPSRAVRVARTLVEQRGYVDRAHVDGILVRSHLELQRLHEEFRVGATVRSLLVPMLALIRTSITQRPIRVVDLGCGMGFILRWLAARGQLGDDIELIGADYNVALIDAAQRLADEEQLRCKFVVANAFDLETPAHAVISTGVLHHFRGDSLAQVFAQHQQSTALGFVHVDIRPSKIAPLGAWVFHQARMREPLARFDGFWSAVRAHSTQTLLDAVAQGAPEFTRATVDARPGLMALLRIFHAAVGVRRELAEQLPAAYASFGSRFALA
jgi:2-polyprenyl-3-methyl-5-hydroxy-6-metoxy-1,4-benzoquinol methylase